MLCEGKKLTLEDTESVYYAHLPIGSQELYETYIGFVEASFVNMLQMIFEDIG